MNAFEAEEVAALDGSHLVVAAGAHCLEADHALSGL
jgi:hypothetical protein